MRAITSSSNLPRRNSCPGSGREEAKYIEPDDTEYSVEGTMLHSLFMRTTPEFEEQRAALTPDQKHALFTAEETTMQFVRWFMEQNGIDESAEHQMIHEAELFLKQGKRIILPGHSDIVINWPSHKARIVADAKFGFMEVEDAAENLQLASYAVQCQQRAPVDKCGVLIAQPRNFGPKSSVATYTAAQMDDAMKEIVRIVLESEKPDAPLSASDKACHFCRAKVACPAYTSKMTPVVVVGELAIETVSNEQLVALLDGVKFAAKIADDVRADMRRRIKAGLITGWKLRNSGSVRKLDKATDFFTCLKEALGGQLTAAEFDACRTMVWGDLEPLVAGKLGISKDKAGELIKRIGAPYVSETEKTPSVVVDKPAKK